MNEQPAPLEEPHVTIVDVENAINVWRNRSPSPVSDDEPLILCTQARTLADLYGRMIVERRTSVPIAKITTAQILALAQAKP
ncbi:DUF3717 domain-containing protein [Paraburkholderia agricolaris]|uniref:DUF3717 domain-containing protein n=1 Tax=Paraburkholderia agricolaris TaxID=2152888 RepID=A0ABW8ZXF4_9BURK